MPMVPSKATLVRVVVEVVQMPRGDLDSVSITVRVHCRMIL